MTEFDIVIAGGGPIGASTAYHLSQQDSGKKIAVISDDPVEDPTHQVTYRYAGGSIRWFWDEPDKREATTVTATFVKDLIKQGVDLSAIEDYYHFVYRGVFAPALNVKGSNLVGYFLSQAAENGVTLQPDTRLTKIEKDGDGYVLSTNSGDIRAKKVLLSLGVANEKFMPGLELGKEKRQLFVTDAVVDDSRSELPHTIVKIGEGYGYVFLKKIDGQLKVVVGQEDIVEDDDETQEVDYYQELIDSPFGDAMPWLREAKVEKILWGVDSETKKLLISDDGAGLYSANCGSAIRSCIYIGQQVSEKLLG